MCNIQEENKACMWKNPAARENDDRIRDFYMQVKEVHGKDLDDNLWIPFLMDKVFHLMCAHNDGKSSHRDQHVENVEISNRDYSYDNHAHHHNIRMSQLETICSRESLKTGPSQCSNEPADSPFSEQFEILNILPSGNIEITCVTTSYRNTSINWPEYPNRYHGWYIFNFGPYFIPRYKWHKQ